ncbi:MAG: 50S ribosomal protein L10 [Campylobacterota bacterium]
MTRNEKVQLVEKLTEEFSQANGIVIADYKGMTVAELEAMRALAYEADVKVRVLNNRLSLIALQNAQKEGLELTQTNIAVWGEDLVAVSKVAVKAAEDSNDKLTVKAGHLDGQAVSKEEVIAYSKLPGREELLGMLLSTWNAPATNLAGVLNAVPSNFVTVLDNIKSQKESA